MQIANGMVILSPENHQFKYDLTPAEVLILHRMHRQYANGTPLADFTIQPGYAVTIERDGIAAEDEYFNQNSGRTIPAKPAIPPVKHKRTQAEEIARLKRKYTGNMSVDGAAKNAFEATFGGAIGIRLPETFDEIEEIVGIKFAHTTEAAAAVDEAEASDPPAPRGRPKKVQE